MQGPLLVANKEIKHINNANNYGPHKQTKWTNHLLTRNSIGRFSKQQYVHNQWVWFSNSKHEESLENLLIELQKWTKNSLIKCCYEHKWHNYISTRAKHSVVKTMCLVLLRTSSPTNFVLFKINLQFCCWSQTFKHMKLLSERKIWWCSDLASSL